MSFRSFILVITISLSIHCSAQSFEELKVLEKNIAGKEFIFDHSRPTFFKDSEGHVKREYNYDSTVRTYLGQVQTKDGRTLKILTIKAFYGPQPHANGRIYIYNGRNQYIGQYNMHSPDEVADWMENSSLVFMTAYGTMKCKISLIKTVSLKNGIPNEFFLGCKGGAGNSYGFQIDR